MATTKKVAKKLPTKKPTARGGSRSVTIPSGVKVVGGIDSLPAVATNGLKYRYQNKLREVAESSAAVGKFVLLAEFVGPGGAHQVRRELMSGKRLIHGKVADWDFQARRVRDGDVGSRLYVAKAK